MATIIPEFILLHAIKAGFEYIQKDYELQTANGVEQNSYLHRILQREQIERYDYLTQAKAVLFKEEDDPRKLKIDLMNNMDFDKVPSIYISLPGEQHGQNNLAVEQDQEPYYNVNNQGEVHSYTNKFTRRKNANYSFYIVSDNSNEVTLLYHIIDCLLISMTAHFSLKGLCNITQGGQDIQLDSDKIPKNLFIKALSVGLQYSRCAPDLSDAPMFTDIMFTGRPTGLKSDETDTPNNLDDI